MCKETGHKSNSCPSKRPAPNASGSVCTCEHCGRKGHRKAQCWAPGGGNEGGQRKGLTPGPRVHVSIKAALATEVRGYSFCAIEGEINNNNVLIVDSGCTTHMFNNRGIFTDFAPTPGRTARNADNSSTPIEGEGRVDLLLRDDDGTWHYVSFHALYVPAYPQNLLSVRDCISKGNSVTFLDYPAIVAPDGCSFPMTETGRLYCVEYKVADNPVCFKAAAIAIWHSRLAHNKPVDLRKLSSSVDGMSYHFVMPVSLAKRPDSLLISHGLQ